MDTFVEAKEKVNELITDLMKAVDKVHHTTYAPHGHYRYNDSRSESMKELSWMVPDYEYQERKFLRNNGHSHKQGKSGKKPHQKTKRSRNHDDDLWFDL
jgi:hypothetical protein